MARLMQKADIDLITNAIQTVMPSGITYNADPSRALMADVESVKATILYADSIRLRSYLFDVFRMSRAEAKLEQMPLPALIVPITMARDWSESTLRAYDMDSQSILPRQVANEFLDKFSKSPMADRLDMINEFAERYWDKIQPIGRAWFQSARKFGDCEDWSGLSPAVDAGLVTIGGWSDIQPKMFEQEYKYVDRASEGIRSLVAEGKQPLAFDQGAENMLQLDQGNRNDLELTRRVLATVPTFSQASISELVDIRRELETPLARFRSAMVEIAADLPQPNDEAYEQEVRDAYRRVMAPSLSEIDELTRENSYLRQLADAAVDVRTWVPSAVGLGIGIAAFTGISEISTAVAGLASIPLTAVRTKSKKKGAIKQNRFFLLWRIKNLPHSKGS